MRWHVVPPFDGMTVRKVFWCKMIEYPIEVISHIGIGSFIDRQRRLCVLNEYMEQPHSNRPEFRHRFDNMSRDGMKAFTKPWKMQLSLNPQHNVTKGHQR